MHQNSIFLKCRYNQKLSIGQKAGNKYSLNQRSVLLKCRYTQKPAIGQKVGNKYS